MLPIMSVKSNLQIFAQFSAKIVHFPQQLRSVARSVKLQNDMRALRNFGFDCGALNGTRILDPFLFHFTSVFHPRQFLLKIHNLFDLHQEPAVDHRQVENLFDAEAGAPISDTPRDGGPP